MKGAILYLCRNTSTDISNLHRNISLVRNIPFLNSFDIIVASEEPIPTSEKYCQVNFTFPDFIDSTRIMVQDAVKHTHGYLHMCAYYAGLMFYEDCLQNYDVLVRLDTDGFLSRMTTDIPKYMYYNNITYMCSGFFEDNDKYIQNMKKHAIDYCSKRGIVYSSDWNNRAFNTNFEIINLPLLRQTDYMDMFDYFWRTGGFYYYRWGDCPFRYLAFDVLKIPYEVMNGIDYRHQSFHRIANV